VRSLRPRYAQRVALVSSRSSRSGKGKAPAFIVGGFVLASLVWLASTPERDGNLPADPEARGRLVERTALALLDPTTRSSIPARSEADRLWTLVEDSHHLVRGLALEALWRGALEATIDRDRLELLKRRAWEDTDFNRRGACCLLLRHDPSVALAPVAALWVKSPNPNTRLELEKVALSSMTRGRKRWLESEAGSSTESARRRFARHVLGPSSVRSAPDLDRSGTSATDHGRVGPDGSTAPTTPTR
jgi:hypothetical protein